MKVLHFYKSAYPDSVGGVEHAIHQLAIGATKLGVKTDVLALTRGDTSKNIEIDGYRVHLEKLDFQIAATGFSMSVLRQFSLLAQKVDVVHFHFPWPFMDVVHFASRVRKPTLLTYHSDIIRQKNLLKLYKPLMYRFLGSVDRIVATSPNYLESSEVLKRFREKVDIIPIGLDKSTYPLADIEIKEKWRRNFGDRFFLFVGVLRYYKGLHILIEAARSLPYPIVIVGAGPVEDELKQQVQELDLTNVHFVGRVNDEDKVALLQLSLAVIFPSHLRSEAFGVSLLEGAMYGKPMISSEIGTGTTFINIDGETGLVVPPSDPAALMQAMIWLWSHPEEALVMGQRAHQRYQELFTADKMVEAHVRLYRELAD